MGTNGQSTVTLGQAEYKVQIPKDFATRRELVVATRANAMRGLSALIGMCLPDLGFTHQYELFQYDALRYGGEVWQRLSKMGHSDPEIIDAGLVLRPLVLALAYPEEGAVNAAVGFTSAPEEGPISKPSPSAEPTASPPDGSTP